MTKEEIKKEFCDLYEIMAGSGKLEYMRAFGGVLKEMMDWMIENKPDAAQEWVWRLGSIRWHNYLTEKEADTIVSSMKPAAPWNREVWMSEMRRYGYDVFEKPYYNTWALYTVMCMIYSDSMDTLKKHIGSGDMFGVIHDLALDKLMDEDKRFDVRRYFLC